MEVFSLMLFACSISGPSNLPTIEHRIALGYCSWMPPAADVNGPRGWYEWVEGDAWAPGTGIVLDGVVIRDGITAGVYLP